MARTLRLLAAARRLRFVGDREGERMERAMDMRRNAEAMALDPESIIRQFPPTEALAERYRAWADALAEQYECERELDEKVNRSIVEDPLAPADEKARARAMLRATFEAGNLRAARLGAALSEMKLRIAVGKV